METSGYWKIRLLISTKVVGRTKGVVTVSSFNNSKTISALVWNLSSVDHAGMAVMAFSTKDFLITKSRISLHRQCSWQKRHES